jgi:hypothetical protein
MAAVFTGASMAPARTSLDTALSLYGRGFKAAFAVLDNDPSTHPPQVLPASSKLRLVGELVYVALFWVATVALIFGLAGVSPIQWLRFRTRQSQPLETQIVALKYEPPLQCEMSIVTRGFLFSPKREGSLRVLLHAMTVPPSKQAIDLSLSICNSGSGGWDYRPFYAWYTFERPVMISTIRWTLPVDDEEKANWLGAGECQHVSLRANPPPNVSVAEATSQPLGVLHFSQNTGESFCEVSLAPQPSK